MWAGLGIIWDLVGKLNWKVWAVLAITITIMVLSVMLHYKNVTIQKQTQQMMALTSAFHQEKTEISNYKNQIDLQNKQISAFVMAKQQNEATIQGLTLTLEALDSVQKIKIDDIKKEPIPKVCDDVVGYLRNNIKDLTW